MQSKYILIDRFCCCKCIVRVFRRNEQYYFRKPINKRHDRIKPIFRLKKKGNKICFNRFPSPCRYFNGWGSSKVLDRLSLEDWHSRHTLTHFQASRVLFFQWQDFNLFRIFSQPKCPDIFESQAIFRISLTLFMIRWISSFHSVDFIYGYGYYYEHGIDCSRETETESDRD